jgi:dolichyl-phosphate-mannose-protein mannosyltransferase
VGLVCDLVVDLKSVTDSTVSTTRNQNQTNAAARPLKSRNFFKKFFELQVLMLQHNAGLTDSHPYATGPINWPFLLSGISFWTGKAEDRQQIYLYGNIVGWWFCVGTLSIFVGIFLADAIARRRGIQPIEDRAST